MISDIDRKTPATLGLWLRFTNKFCQMENGIQKQSFLQTRNKIRSFQL